MSDSLKKSVTIQAPAEVAFRVFTQLKSWWPLDSHHIGKAKAIDARIEPKAGGRWFEIGEDGSECNWGRVLAWEPPKRIHLTWEIDADWKANTAVKSEVEVRFIAEGPNVTRVELEHTKLDAYGERAAEMHGIFDAEDGWNGLLQGFKMAVEMS
jgi:uncharacterized protein YndB with AHSA1/START domain